MSLLTSASAVGSFPDCVFTVAAAMAGPVKTTVAKRWVALIAVMMVACGIFSWQLHQGQHMDQLHQVCLLSHTVSASLILLSVFLSLYP